VRQTASRELGKMTSSSAYKNTGEKDYRDVAQEDTILQDRLFEAGEHPAFITVAAGGTYNLTNFESLRLDVSVTLPCLVSEVDAAIEQAAALVEGKLGEEEIQWLGQKYPRG
jgi:hypothetical protein